MTFNEKIDKFMSEKGITNLKQFANLVDIPYTTLRDFYDKQSADNSRLATIRKLSTYMNCSMDYLSFDEIDNFNGKLNFDNAIPIELPKRIVKIPVLGTIKAGLPINAQQDIIEYVDIPEEWTRGGKEFYGLKISGDSMEPKYNEKDIVIFEHTSDFSIANNKDCAVMVNGFDATFKNVSISEAGLTLIPGNLNNSDGYKPTFYSIEQIEKLPVKIIGIAREKRTRL